MSYQDYLHTKFIEFHNKCGREKIDCEAEFYKARGHTEPLKKADTGICQSNQDCKEPQQFYYCVACRHRRCCGKHMYFCNYCGDHVCDYCVPFTTGSAEVAYKQRTVCAGCIARVFAMGPTCLSYTFLIKYCPSNLYAKS